MKYSQERPLITEDPPRMLMFIQARNPKNAHRGDMDVFGKSFLVSVSNLMLDKLLFKQTF